MFQGLALLPKGLSLFLDGAKLVTLAVHFFAKGEDFRGEETLEVFFGVLSQFVFNS